MISLLHPSRGRPEKALETLLKWKDSAVDYEQVDHVLSLDSDDPYLDEYLSLFLDPDLNSIELHRDNKSVVEATNFSVHAIHGWDITDILVYLSDDFDCPKGWDQLIRNEFKDSNRPSLIKVDDCLQKFHVPVLTIPIMNRALYQKLGYFWHPEYKSMFVDEDLYWTCKNNGWIKECPHLKFPHNHHSTGVCENDETYKRSAANWDQGKEVFQRRKKEGFPL